MNFSSVRQILFFVAPLAFVLVGCYPPVPPPPVPDSEPVSYIVDEGSQLVSDSYNSEQREESVSVAVICEPSTPLELIRNEIAETYQSQNALRGRLSSVRSSILKKTEEMKELEVLFEQKMLEHNAKEKRRIVLLADIERLRNEKDAIEYNLNVVP